MNIVSELQALSSIIPSINPKRNYWLVRTLGGEYYDEFVTDGYIAIGFNEITLYDINNTKREDLKPLIDKILKYDEKNLKPSHTAAQLLKFVNEIKKGDVVIIPSRSSFTVTFGEVTDSIVYLDTAIKSAHACPYIKRKKVKWLKTVLRDKLDPNLYKLMYSRHIISEAMAYAPYIDRTIHPLFIKGEEIHLMLDVQTKNPINAREFFKSGDLILDIADEFGKEYGVDIRVNEIDTKTYLQSPGFIELIGFTVVGMAIIGYLIICLAGGGYEIKAKILPTFNMKTDGILKALTHFLDKRNERQMKRQLLEKYLNDMNMTIGPDAIKLLLSGSDEKKDIATKDNEEKS